MKLPLKYHATKHEECRVIIYDKWHVITGKVTQELLSDNM